jgi:methylenetetrahydrofolate dehydrogenase (NADP+)/methenyltetrahydrofolate cyclohydrolase
MTAIQLDGKTLAQDIQSDMAHRVSTAFNLHGRTIGLAVIQVGDDPASTLYIKNKAQACKRVGIETYTHHFPADISSSEILKTMGLLNQDPKIHGILLQLPLPPQLDSLSLLETILPQKDVDGFHPYHLGRLAQRRPILRPCTPKGIMKLLEAYHLSPKGLEATVVGASNIVGRPLALELLLAGATVTLCHRFTGNLQKHCQNADILCVAVGKPDLIPGSWIKPGAIVIDVGINRLQNQSITGDVDFETARMRAAYITPVPGGVGPMTIAMLLENTLICAGVIPP